MAKREKGYFNWDEGNYNGEVFRGKPDGRGKFQYFNGTSYDGEWSSGMKHGHGLFVFSNSDRFVGGWKEDNRHGIGTYFFKNGAKHVGEWKLGQKEGKFVFYPSGLSSNPSIPKVEKYEGGQKIIRIMSLTPTEDPILRTTPRTPLAGLPFLTNEEEEFINMVNLEKERNLKRMIPTTPKTPLSAKSNKDIPFSYKKEEEEGEGEGEEEPKKREITIELFPEDNSQVSGFAAAPFEAQEELEVSVNENESFRIVETMDDWTYVIKGNNEEGYIPTNFIRVGCQSPPIPKDPKMRKSMEQLRKDITSQEEENVKKKEEEEPREAIATFKFEGEGDEEISVEEGDKVMVLVEDGEWLKIRKENGKEGFIPAVFVQFL